MPLYGYTIGDVDVSTAAGNQFEVYRFSLTTRVAERVGTVTVGNIANPDLEGLGTNPTTGRVSAVNEPLPGTASESIFRVGPVDKPFAPTTVTPTRSPSTLNRFGSEAGADFGRDGGTGSVVLYSTGGNDSTADGPIGTSLYKTTVTTPGVITLVDSTPTTAERAGTTPTNPGKYTDGLAIDNLVPGRTRAFASDFRTSDGDGNQLHKVDLLTGQLSAPIQIRTTGGTPTTYNLDSGLAFTQQSPNGLYALLENGTLLQFSNFTDELNAPGLQVSGSYTGGTANGFVNVTVLGTVSGLRAGADYEGFTIVNEPV